MNTADTKHKPLVHSNYLHTCLEPRELRRTIKHVVRRLYPLRHEFDTIAFRGASGCLVGPIVAMRLNKQMLLVRRGEDCHSHYTVEGNIATERYCIVDDMTATGKTVTSIVGAIKTEQRALQARLGRLDYYLCNDPNESLLSPNPAAAVGKAVLVALYRLPSYNDELRSYPTLTDHIRTIGCRPLPI